MYYSNGRVCVYVKNKIIGKVECSAEGALEGILVSLQRHSKRG